MAISLGRSLTSPFFVFAQIVNAVCLFFILLGLSRFLIVLSTIRGAMGAGATDTGTSADPAEVMASYWYLVSRCAHLSVASLFDGPVVVRIRPGALPVDGNRATDSSALQFLCMHLLASLALAYPLALSVQRRKFVLDFVLTIYGVYAVSTSVVLRRFLGGGGLHWYATVGAAASVTHAATWLICRRRELAEISVGGGPVVATATVPLASRQADTEEAEEMAEVRRGAVNRTPPAPSPSAALGELSLAAGGLTAPGSASRRKDR